jgi:predicted nucleotidyltransferase
MLDALYRAERYRELAEEFRSVAQTCASTKMQNHYSQISKHYSRLAVRHFCNYRQAQKRLVAARAPSSRTTSMRRVACH